MYKKIFVVLLVLGLLTVLFAACGIRDTATTVSGPTVGMGGASFLKSSITIKKGDILTMIDSVSTQHIIRNGMWVGNKQVTAKEPGAPTVDFTVNNQGDSGTAGPFNTAGTFHIYCTVHPGMNLTVTVQ